MADSPRVLRFTLEAKTWPALKLGLKLAIWRVLTLTLYWFWAETRIRRAFAHASALGGDRFEYSGTGLQMFIGFLIAMGIILPMRGLFHLGSVLGASAWLAPVEGLFWIGLWSLALPFFAWRYRMTNLSWRAIRFGFDGGFARYLRAMALPFLLGLLTLGILWPRFMLIRRRWLVAHTRFGSERFAVQAGPATALWPWYIAAGAAAAAFLLIGVLVATGLNPSVSGLLFLATFTAWVFSLAGMYFAIDRVVANETLIAGARIRAWYSIWPLPLRYASWLFALLLPLALFGPTLAAVASLVPAQQMLALVHLSWGLMLLGWVVVLFTWSLPFVRLPILRHMLRHSALDGRLLIEQVGAGDPGRGGNDALAALWPVA